MNKTEKYPMLMQPVPRELIWGGTKLKNRFGKTAPFENIAESWEVSVRDEAPSVIANGIYSGMTLKEYLDFSEEEFPILIKLIDSGDRLSVQVHPDDSVTDKYGNSLGKTEMWYIIDAQPDAEIVYGLKRGLTPEQFKEAVEKGETEKCLSFVKCKKGDVFFIPAGLVHAIGKGVLLAEIQQNSDTTYRIFDYDRIGKDGKKRQLHIDEAMSCIVNYQQKEIDSIRFKNGKAEDILASCDKFTTVRYAISNSVSLDEPGFSVILCTEGEGHIENNGQLYPIYSGETYFIPSGTGKIEVSGELEFLYIKTA